MTFLDSSGVSEALPVLIVGGGAAGLSAAAELHRAGKKFLLVEARARLGGRIYSVPVAGVSYPVELGAEFIHGRPEALKSVLGRAAQVPDESWIAKGGILKPWDQEDELGTVLQALGKLATPVDLTMDQALAKVQGDFSAPTLQRAKLWTTGFHAARLGEVSARAIAAAGATSGSSEAEESYRLGGGYGSLVDKLIAPLGPLEHWARLSTIVEHISWSRKETTVRVRHGRGVENIVAKQVLITAPVSVWGDIGFSPPLPAAKQMAMQRLGSGPVHRVTLLFREPFWQHSDFNPSFIQNFESAFPVYWTQRPFDGPRFVCWCGGDPADGIDNPITQAIAALAQTLGLEIKSITEQLVSSHHHDWNRDPFSKGAYAYFRPGYETAADILADPIDDSVYFAGEALAKEGRNGTVDGAIQTGLEAARHLVS